MKLRAYSLQLHLLAVLAVALAPVLVVGVLATVWSSKQLHDTARQQLQANANAMADMVDQRFISYAQILRLKTATVPQAGTAFLPQVKTTQRILTELTLLDLRDPVQRAALPSMFLDQLSTSKGITVSDLLIPAHPAYAAQPLQMAIGVSSDALHGAAPFALLVPSSEVIDLEQETSTTPDGLLIAVLDSQGRIAARSRNQAQWLGQPVPDWDKLVALGTDHGVFSATAAEGGTLELAFKRLNTAHNWVLVVGQDQKRLNAAWVAPLRGTLIGAFLTALASLLLARWASQRILRSLKTVQNNSRVVLEEGALLAPPMSQKGVSIREFDELSDTFTRAQALLAQQAQEAQALAQHLQRNKAKHRAVAEVGALVFWQASTNWEVTQLTGWQDLTGQSEADALGRGWHPRIHPNDLDAMVANWPTGDTVDVEFRILDANARWHWVRARGARIVDTHSGEAEWVGVLEDVDARLRAQARIGYLAKYDPLTGLANRSHFRTLLTAAISREEPCWATVMCMDLDRFIQINDALGHAVGDELLQRVTARLMGLLPPEGVLARFSGDEFAVMFKTATPLVDAQQLGERILVAFQEPFVIHSHTINVNTSIGVALHQSHGDSAEHIMRHAEMALHRAKADGRGRLRFFEPTMDQQMQRRREMEVDLRAGLEKGQFHLVYQPVIDLPSLQLVGFEALLRWQHPYLGVLAPGRFIAIAEDIGLMEPLGAWVLEQACRDALSWSDTGLKVAVNVSASQLTGKIHHHVTQMLNATGLPARRLELEVTENALMTHIESASKSLLELKAAGVAIVLDDFGTGYTSLSHLRAFPFDKVKIDKAFVQDLSTVNHDYDGAAIISAITLLCNRLDIVAVAEGVELAEQMNQVLGYECQQAQGFLFGRPCRHEEVAGIIEGWSTVRQRIALLKTPPHQHPW